MTKWELQKQRQILSSWNSFYSNDSISLAAPRYLKISKIKNDSEIKVYPYVEDNSNKHYGSTIQYSNRYKEDRDKVLKLSKELYDNQLLLNKYYTDK